MVEALVDVAALLQGKELSAIKTSKDIVVKFSELYKVSNQYIMEKVSGIPRTVAQSLGYSEHLMLLMMGTNTNKKCYRMMDLMEWNIRDNDIPKFNFGICVDSFGKWKLLLCHKTFPAPICAVNCESECWLFSTGRRNRGTVYRSLKEGRMPRRRRVLYYIIKK